MVEEPLVSVIIPVYNGEKYLRNAVESALGQTGVNLEILILDDASIDETKQIARKLCSLYSQIRYYRNHENIGVARTRNHGFTLARGEYIALLDADDIWLENKLEQQLAMIKNQNLDVCYTGYSFIDFDGVTLGNPYYASESLTIKRLICENIVGCSTAVMRINAIQGVRMRPEYAHEDYVFWLELMQKGCKFGGIKRPLVHYRVLKGSRSGDKKQAALNRWKIYRNFLNMNPLSAFAAFVFYAIRGIYKHYIKL